MNLGIPSWNLALVMTLLAVPFTRTCIEDALASQRLRLRRERSFLGHVLYSAYSLGAGMWVWVFVYAAWVRS